MVIASESFSRRCHPGALASTAFQFDDRPPQLPRAAWRHKAHCGWVKKRIEAAGRTGNGGQSGRQRLESRGRNAFHPAARRLKGRNDEEVCPKKQFLFGPTGYRPDKTDSRPDLAGHCPEARFVWTLTREDQLHPGESGNRTDGGREPFDRHESAERENRELRQPSSLTCRCTIHRRGGLDAHRTHVGDRMRPGLVTSMKAGEHTLPVVW